MLSIEKIKALYSVFKAGEEVADKKKWVGHQISANMIAALLFAIVSLLRSFGYDFGIDMQTCADIAIGLLSAINIGINIATSKDHGLPSGAVRETEQTVRSDEQPAEEKPANVQAEIAPDAGRGIVNASIDDDVRARALEWARQHSTTNGLSNDA
jgi:hypothetical protein